MRLRAILFGVAAMAGICLPARGQLVSHTFELQPGYNAITIPVLRGNNTLNELLPDVPPGTELVKFNSSGGFTVSVFVDPASGWNPNGGFAGSLFPGEGAFLRLPGGMPNPVQVSVFGQKPIPHGLFNARPGFNFVGCQVAEPCAFEQLMGFTPQPGDAVYQFDNAVNTPGAPPQPSDASTTNRYRTNGWDVAPIIPPLRGVFVELANAPRVIIDPQILTVPAGSNATFNAIITGGTPRNFQWRRNGNPIPGQTNFLLTVTNATQAQAGTYSVVVQFMSGLIVTSVNARLNIAVPPIITKQPESLVATQGGVAEFSVRATGTAPLFYQWTRNGAVVAPFSLDLTNLVISNVQLSHAGAYAVRVMNIAGSVISTQSATLTVLVPPLIIRQPMSQMVNPGGNVTLTVDVHPDATQPLSYHWQRNGNIIATTMQPSLTINNIRTDQSGAYSVIVANPVGAELSEEANIMVAGGGGACNLSDPFPGCIITGPNGIVQGVNLDATREPGEPRHAGKRGSNSVWVTYISSTPGIVTFETRGSSFDTLLAAYLGNTVDNLFRVASDDDSGGFLSSVISFSVEPGLEYHIVVDGHAGQRGSVVLTWRFEDTGDELPVITQHPRSLVVPRGAAAQFFVNVQGAVNGFQWVFNGTSLPGATQPVLTIQNVSEAHVGRYFARIGVGNRFIDSHPADLDLREMDGPGQPPLIRAFDKFEDLLAALEGDPPDARFTPASVVLGYTGSQTFSTTGSGGQNGEPVHCDVVGGHSKWYAYIPPTNGTLHLNTDGSNFDTLLAVYTGCCTFATLTPVDCDNNSGTNGLASSLSFWATSNTVYYIAVDGVGGVTGTVKLNYRLLVQMMLTNLSSTTNSLTFQLNATPAWPFTVQRSTNFIDWSNFLTATSASGIYLFTDTNLPPNRRFYRSMQTP